MRAVDTNVLVRLVTRDDAKQASSADQFVAGGGWISQLVLMELVWVLESVYARTSAQISLTVEMLLNHESLVVQDPDSVLAAVQQFRTKPPISFSDCLILEAARKAGHLPLGTFDRRLAKHTGAQRL